jgi:hypothetical protein
VEVFDTASTRGTLLKHDVLNNIYKSSSYLTGNTRVISRKIALLITAAVRTSNLCPRAKRWSIGGMEIKLYGMAMLLGH